MAGSLLFVDDGSTMHRVLHIALARHNLAVLVGRPAPQARPEARKRRRAARRALAAGPWPLPTPRRQLIHRLLSPLATQGAGAALPDGGAPRAALLQSAPGGAG